MEAKKHWKSNTMWVNAILAITAMVFPPAHDWIVAHPDYVVYGFTAINIVLRWISNGAIELEVLGFIHHAHATLAELFENLIVGYGLVDHIVRSRWTMSSI